MTDQPLRVEVVAYAPTAFYHCTQCEVVWQETGFSGSIRKEQAASALPPDLLQDYQSVSDWVHHLLAKYCDRVVVQVTDAASLPGVWRALRHGVRRYPAVLVAGQRFADFGEAERAIERELAARGATVTGGAAAA